MSPPSYPGGTAAITESLLKHRWSVTILRHLHAGITSPAQICARESGLSPRAMNQRLRNMLRYRLIARRSKSGTNGDVEYELTQTGRSILGLLDLIYQLDRQSLAQQTLPQALTDSNPANNSATAAPSGPAHAKATDTIPASSLHHLPLDP